MPVPGATPKKPASGLMACKYGTSPIFSHAISSTTVQTRYPCSSSADTIIAIFVFPHALGNAAPMYVTVPPGDSSPSFFFQAEDGIRDYKVTGVQTCALPI